MKLGALVSQSYLLDLQQPSVLASYIMQHPDMLLLMEDIARGSGNGSGRTTAKNGVNRDSLTSAVIDTIERLIKKQSDIVAQHASPSRVATVALASSRPASSLLGIAHGNIHVSPYSCIMLVCCVIELNMLFLMTVLMYMFTRTSKRKLHGL